MAGICTYIYVHVHIHICIYVHIHMYLGCILKAELLKHQASVLSFF